MIAEHLSLTPEREVEVNLTSLAAADDCDDDYYEALKSPNLYKSIFKQERWVAEMFVNMSLSVMQMNKHIGKKMIHK